MFAEKCEYKNIHIFFFSKNIRLYTIFNDQSFSDTLTNDIISFEQLGPVYYISSSVRCVSETGQLDNTIDE